MAFNPDRLSLIVQPLGDAGMRIYNYQSDDVQTTITGTGYFEEATKRGLRPFDIIFVSPISGATEPFIVNIDSIDSDGNATGAMTIAPALNSDGGLTLDDPTTFQQSVPITPFGGGAWYAANHLRATLDGSTATARFTLGVSMETSGDNANGPSLAAGAHWFHVQKEDYLTSTKTGEIDGIYGVVNQGIYGDVGGMLIGAYKQIGGTGSITGIEISGNRVSGSSLNNQQSLTTVMNYVGSDLAFEVAGGSGARSHGFYAEARGGQQLYSAFTAMEGTEFSTTLDGVPTAGSLLYYISGHTSRSVGARKFSVSTAGQMYLVASTAIDHLDLRTTYAGTDPSGIRLQKSGATTSGQALHYVQSFGYSSTSVARQYAAIYSEAVDTTNASEDGRWGFYTIVAGTNAARVYIGGGIYTASVTGGDKGAGTANIGTLYENNVRVVSSAGTTGGTGSGGAGNQYVVLSVNGTNYKILHDGTV